MSNSRTFSRFPLSKTNCKEISELLSKLSYSIKPKPMTLIRTIFSSSKTTKNNCLRSMIVLKTSNLNYKIFKTKKTTKPKSQFIPSPNYNPTSKLTPSLLRKTIKISLIILMMIKKWNHCGIKWTKKWTFFSKNGMIKDQT